VSASSPSSSFGPSTPGAGPTSQRYEIPPRPKPGRKPATDEPASKRKAQNRESQRAFRARKVAKLEEMQSTLDATDRQHREELRVVESTLTHEVARGWTRRPKRQATSRTAPTSSKTCLSVL
jgi:hypothetical protein